MNNLIQFENIEVGERFFDPNTAEDFAKVCGNAAEHLIGGNYHSGQLMTFEPTELVQIITN
jgi:hypothetical protein